MENEQQELMFKLAMFEQKVQHLQHQLSAVEESLVDFGILLSGLDEIKDSVGKEILAPLGRGIFVNTKLASDKLIVDIGGKNLVGKSVSETKKMISDQLEKLSMAKESLIEKISKSEEELSEIISGAREED